MSLEYLLTWMMVLLRSVAKGEDITQDISTLENPAILEQLKQAL